MLNPREAHMTVFHMNYLYAIGGNTPTVERYRLQDDEWESLPSIPLATKDMGVIFMESPPSIYALGGRGRELTLDTIQKLDLVVLKLEILGLKLPSFVRWMLQSR
mmetsp:Transcript_29241/g.52253  ORF Transcript_29241/g.52253 Transcript_29241/m.52253 type:complete len:105 (+) Transcript_29241:130-444(+)